LLQDSSITILTIEATSSYISDSRSITVWSTDNNFRNLNNYPLYLKNPKTIELFF
jgi:hypothetical protein